ncbi:MAG: PKD domain-containing protein [Bacteroidetes bacterium]|nr:PKD domain-containing protein [Bacteroidota bacterium]
MKKIILALFLLLASVVSIAVPNADFTWVHTNNGCLPGDTAIFTNTSTGAHTYKWDFGDFSPFYYGDDTSHAYTWAWTFTVSLTAYDTISGDSDLVMKVVTIRNLPMPWFFSSPPNPVCPATPVEFNTFMFPTPDSVKWYFGDGDSSAIMTPTHLYSDTGIFFVSLIAYNQCGSDTATNPVDLDSSAGPGIPGIWSDKTSACPGEPISFNLWLMPLPDSIKWECGDGTFAYVQNPGHSYSLPGIYNVRVIAFNACSSDTSGTIVIAISNTLIPTVTATVYPDSVCPDDIVNFNGSTFGLQNWIWDFGDGDNSFLAVTTHSYSSMATYTAVYTGTNYCDSTRTDTVTVFVGDSVPPSMVSFTSSPWSNCAVFTEICPGTPVNFTNTSSSISTSFWDFDDSTTSALNNPVHVFPDSGTYDVKLVVTSSCGGKDSVTNCIYVSDEVNPNAWFCINPPMCMPSPTVCVGSIVTFQIWNPDTASIIWDFGDGDSSFIANPTHIYSTIGSYIVTLRITNSCGRTAVQSQNITVSTTGTPPSMADFWYNPNSSCPGDPVNFNGWGMNATQWWWDFGDGDTSILQNVNHTYSSSGTYNVTFVAKNGCGTDTVRKSYSVNSGSSPGFSVAPAGCYGVPIAFADTSSPVPASWQWDFGDGDTSTAQNPSHTFASEGVYNVTLMVSFSGCNSSVTKAVNLELTLGASSVNSTCNLANGNATVTVIQGNPPFTYQWDAAAGGQTTSTATGLIAGTYKVTVSDTRGCLDSISAAVGNTNIPSTDPASASAAPAVICPAGSSTLSVSGGSLGTGADWQWYSGSCGGGVVGSGVSVVVTPGVTTTYYVRAEGTCNTTACVSVTVTVNTSSTDPASASAVPAAICPAGSSTLSVSGGSLGTGADWQWYSGSCGGAAVGSGASVVVSPGVTTTYYVRAEGTCNTTACVSITVTVNTSSTDPASASAAPAAICPAGSSTLSVAGGSLGTGADWQWYSGSCGGGAVGSGASVVVTPGSTTTYYVRAEGTCNTTACVTVTVTVNTLSTDPASASAAPAAICPAGSSTLSVSGGSLGTGADWQWYSGSCGGVPVGSGASVVVTPGATTTYYVRAEGTCNTTTCVNVAVNVNSNSTAAASITPTINPICDGGSTTLNITGGSLGTGATWQWYSASCGGIAEGSGSSLSVSPSDTTVYYVRAEGTCNTTACVNVTVTVNTPATADAGIDVTICEGACYTLSGTIGGGASTSVWTTSGDGSFDDQTLLTATYCPGPNDLTGGSVTLTLITDNPAGPCPAASDAMTLTINQAATVSAGSDAAICAGNTYTLSGTRGGSATGSAWTTSGSGTFDNPSLLNATYTPSPADTASGCVILTLTTNDPAGPCPAVSDAMNLCFNPEENPSFNYSSGSYCQSGIDPVPTITGTPGGTFNSSPGGMTINAVNGTIDLDMSALGLYSVEYVTGGVCPDSSMVGITITASFDATFSYATPICGSGANELPAFPVGASAGVFSSNPAGVSFVNVNTGEIIPVASVPGTYDITNFIAPSGGCAADSFTFSITIDLAATVGAGANGAVCENSSYALSGTIGGGVTSSTWTTNGSGTFNDSSLLAATYTPGPSDITMGTITNTLTTNDPAGPCSAVSDIMLLTVNQEAIVSAGSDATICEGSIYTLSGATGGSASSSTWATSGDGTFNDPTLLAAIYTPGATDITLGNTTLTLTTDDPVGPCPSVSDAMLLIINSAATVNAGADDFICEGSSYTLNGARGGSAATSTWSTPGDGTFDNPALLNATYTPGPSDIAMGAITLTIITDDPSGPCPAVTDNIGLTFAGLPAVTASATDALCNASCDGTAGISITGGTAPFGYQWDVAAGSQTTSSATGLCSGTYDITVTDDNGCAGTDSATVGEPAVLSLSVVTTTDASCAGACDGSAEVSSGGGTSPYNYYWDAGAGSQTTSGATGLCASTYSATVTDNNGCTAIASATINESTTITLILGSADATCGTSDGSAFVSVSGGTPPYGYIWSDSLTQAGDTAVSLASGTYSVTVDDANGCTKTGITAVNDIEGPVILISSVINVSCNGGNNGEVTASASGGILPYSYQWDITAGSQTTATATGLPDGTYMVNVSDSNNCQTFTSATVTEPPALTVTFSASDANCGQNDGSATALPAGGTVSYTYQWDSSAGSQMTAVATGLLAGSYSITITDANNCTVTGSVTLNDQPGVSIDNITGTDALCNTICNGTAVASVSGGSVPFSYLWNDPLNQTDLTATGLCAGSFGFTVTDGNECSDSGYISINEPAAITISTSGTDATCAGGCDGTASAAVTGGIGPYSYQWNDISMQTGSTAIALCDGIVDLTVTDANGCSVNSSATVNSPSAISLFISSVSASCGNNDGQAIVSSTGGTPPYLYLWNDGLGQTSDTASGLAAGIYSVTVTDANICTASGAVFINNTGAPSIPFTGATDVSCNGGSDGTASITVSGGTPPYDILWDSQTGGQTTMTATGLSAGNYVASVSDSLGCTVYAFATVNEPAAIAVITDSLFDVNCDGGSDGRIFITVSGGYSPYTYLWSSGNTVEDIVNITAGIYALTINDGNGCVDSLTVTVNEPASVSVGLNVTGTSCSACDGSADATVSGGVAPYSYQWDDPMVQTSSTATGLCATGYNVTVTDINGCTVTSSATVPAPGGLTSSISSSVPASCSGSCDGSATVQISGGTPPYAVLWDDSSSQATLTATGLCAGTFQATVTDSNNCATVADVTISEPAILAVTISSVNASCNGICDAATNASVTGGTPSYSFNWSTGSTDSGETGLCPGSYDLTVTDSNGCMATQSTSVTEPQIFSISVATTDVSCFGSCDGSFTISASGGTPPYAGTGTANNVCAGLYPVTISDANGCTASDSAVVSEPLPLVIDSMTSVNASCPDTTCPDGSAEVTASGGTGALTYQWSNGAAADSITGLISGLYTVTVTDANGCTVSGSVVVDFAVGEGRLINSGLTFEVFPNPAKEKITVLLSQNTGIRKIKLIDINGRVVQEHFVQYGLNPIILNVNDLPEGMYAIIVEVNDKQEGIRHLFIAR